MLVVVVLLPLWCGARVGGAKTLKLFHFNRNTNKGSGGNEKLLPRRIPTVGIVRKVPSTRTQLFHKHHHHGGAVCPSYGAVTLDTPDPTRATSSEGVGRRRIRWVWYKTIK
jgi:hypothetical protein